MPRRKSDRFKLLHKIADRHENQAAQALGVSVGNLQAQQSRLAELQQFREEYTRMFHQSGSTGITVSAMQSYQSFIHQIDQAIQQQKRTVSLAEQERSSKMSEWEKRHRKSKIYSKTLERVVADELDSLEQRQDAEIDDRNNALHNKK